MQISLNNAKIIFSTGYLLITTMAILLIIASLGFFAGTGIAGWQFPVAFILAGAIYFYTGQNDYKHTAIFLKSFLTCIVIITLSVIIALNFYDVSYDGQSYHMEGIYQLKNGWNPFRSALPKSVNMAIYINHYSKAVELPQSILYSLTNRIEAGKASTLILFAAGFCLTLSFLLNLHKLSTIKCVLLSLLAMLNPIIVNQLISTYVDGQLAILLLCFFVVILMVIKNADYVNLVLLGAIVIITANVKFTGLVYMVFFITAFLAWLLFVRQTNLFKKTLYTAMLSGFIAVFLVGYNPYVTNTIKHSHPFYPLMGKNQVDIMDHNMPEGFEKESAARKFFTSLFARTDNVMRGNGKKIELKIPFAINKTDIINAYSIDTRIAGLGPLFSGLILLSIISFITFLLTAGSSSPAVKNSLYVLGIILISICMVPESWWVRYVPQLWYVPLIMLLTIELYAVRNLRELKVLLYLVFIINSCFSLLTFRFNLMMTHMVNAQLEKLKTSHQTIIVQWGSAKANRIRFEENKIPYVERNLDDIPNTENIICSDSKFIIPDNSSTTHQ